MSSKVTCVRALASALLMSAMAPATVVAQAIGTSFVYQGALKDGASFASGLHDFRFRLYDAAAGGAQVGPTMCLDDVTLDQGRFTVALDFGAVFNGLQRHLEIEVRRDTGLNCSNAAGFVVLAPRQPLAAAPHALLALNAQTALDAANANLLGGQSGQFYQNAGNLTSGFLPDARLSGNIPRLSAANAFGNFTNTFAGPVGVRTTSPLGGLHVRQEPLSFGGTMALEGSTHSYVSFFPAGVSAGRRAYLGFAAAGTSSITLANESVSGVIHLVPGGPNGNVEIGTGLTNFSFKLNVNGGINTYGQLQVVGNICATGNIGQCSDERYKAQVEPLDGALGVVERLRPVTFDWKRETFSERDFPDGRQIGLLAQEVREVLPQLVSEGHDGYLSVDYGRLTPILAQAVKEQQRELERQRDQIERLIALNAALESRLEALERAAPAARAER